MNLAPIALFAYHRREHLAYTLVALQRNALAANSDLYIFSDAAKEPKLVPGVNEVRNYIRTISGFKSVQVIEQKTNIGLANSIINGATQLCTDFGKVIVVEDDLIVSPYFLDYMNQALNRYADDNQVMQVSGYMFPVKASPKTNAVFLPLTTSWGWATWQRAWQQFDPLMKRYSELEETPNLRMSFDLDGAYPYFDMLEAQRKGDIDSWAVRWYLSVFMNKGLVLHPARTLVKNIGFDQSGTHSGTRSDSFDDASITFPSYEETINHFPSTVQIDYAFFEAVKKAVRQSTGRGSWIVRTLIDRIHRLNRKATPLP